MGDILGSRVFCVSAHCEADLRIHCCRLRDHRFLAPRAIPYLNLTGRLTQADASMSFGFSVSDFVFCGQLAYQLYTEFKEAAGECQAFAKELLLLHQVMLKTGALIGRGGNVLDEAEQATLDLCLDMCKEILFVQIADGDNFTLDGNLMGYGQRMLLSDPLDGKMSYGQRLVLNRPNFPFINGYDRTLLDWICSVRRKFEERKFAKKIPKIRTAISTVTEKLTSFQVLMIR